MSKSVPKQVTWIPAHDSYGSVSMRRYASFLEESLREDDRYGCELLIRPVRDQAASRWVRQFHRRVAYPLKVRVSSHGTIAHILDHSWADLLEWIPKGMKRVVTVHDLIPLRSLEELSDARRARFRSWVQHLHEADLIIAVSCYTRDELVDLLGVNLNKIRVVPNGVDRPSFHGTPLWMQQRLADKKSCFNIGSLGSALPRKNLEIFVDALAEFRHRTGLTPCLIRAGKQLPDRLREQFVSRLGEEALIELGELRDQDLDGFYQSVDVVVVPSKFEGFGLPVLEAMIRQKPVVAAASSSLPEVGGDAAMYFAPDCPEQLARCLEALTADETRKMMAIKGFERAEQFSWRACLEGIFSVYDELT